MYAKLTYILSCIAFLASSCTSDTPVDTGDVASAKKGAEMSFDVSNISRASVTTSFSNFAVYGDIRFQGQTSLTPIVLFNKTEVEYKDNAWRYEGTQYWMPEYEHSFVAISPLSILNADNNPQYTNSQLSFTYTLPTTAEGKLNRNDDVTDIIAATHRRLYDEKDENITTTFKFNHILSLINFAPALDDNVLPEDSYILLHKLVLSGFRTKADFKILPADRQSNSETDDRVVEVVGQEGNGNYTLVFNNPIKLENNRKNVTLMDANDAILMLPQTFAADSDAQILLQYSVNDDPRTVEVSLPLKGQNWDSGKNYTYKFTIKRTGPHFDSTTITDWDMLNVGSIIVR